MNRVPVIVRNPAFVEELEPDGDEVDPVDISPFMEGDTPIITSPTSEDEKVDDVMERLGKSRELLKEINDVISSLSENMSSNQHTVVPNVDVWDTGKATEQEYRLHPDSTMEEIRDRLANQVWDLLQVFQERVDQQTYDSKDIEFISGLHNILVLNNRLRIMTDLELNCHTV